MKKYKHIFFDLDHTLWDFNKNASEALTEIYILFDLPSEGIESLELFLTAYRNRNEVMWEQYRYGRIDKATLRDKRFEFALLDLGIENVLLSKSLSAEYTKRAPRKTALFPHAKEVLEKLSVSHKLHILTNGFKETQFIKLNSSGLDTYFTHILISEELGYKKPEIEIFNLALNMAGTHKEESVMIGDNLQVDILGAKNAGIDQVYFNPEGLKHRETITFEIGSLQELLQIFL